ncbi:MAG: choloylglycine hydrolase family protein [Chlamydiota bacterium]
MKNFLFFLMLGSLFAIGQSNACTGIRLIAKNGEIVHGRTLEFGTPLPTSIAVIPRGYPFQGTTPLGVGLSYKAKYGVVGAVLFDSSAAMDGMNEKGLSVGTFFFPGYAEYASITSVNQSRAVSPTEFPNWLLTQFANVEEVKSALEQIAIAPTQIDGWGSTPPPFHYIVYDQAGGCIVIEPIKGKLIVYDNPLGVLTNSPTFDWHMTNLRNYINLRTVNVPPLKINGLELAPFGQGSGMVGLPGDFTPPSRFIRAAVFSYTAIPSATGEEAVLQIFHLLNQFDIPVGVVRDVKNGTVHPDSTMVTCARDPNTLKYYFKTYKDQTLRMVDLNEFDLNAKKIKKIKADGNEPIVNVSADLK